MSVKILVNGPAGGGKSTLVRRVMSVYHIVMITPGGVGGLPLAYLCERDDHTLVVLGNYETHLRSHHGLSQFNRHPSAFDRCLSLANTVDHDVLCEGSFLHSSRLYTPNGLAFCANATLLWLEPSDARRLATLRDRPQLSDAGYERHAHNAARTSTDMVRLGTKRIAITDRDEALQFVFSQFGLQLDAASTPCPPSDPR